MWKTWCSSSTSILHRASRITRLELACLENILCAKHLAGLVLCQKVLKISLLVLIFHVALVCMESLNIDIRPKLFLWNNVTQISKYMDSYFWIGTVCDNISSNVGFSKKKGSSCCGTSGTVSVAGSFQKKQQQSLAIIFFILSFPT